MDWALAFEKIAPTTLVHRRDNFRALEHSVQALQESSVTIKTPFAPSQLLGNGKTLDKLEITKVKSDETETIDLDHLFVNYGFKSSVGNLKNWGSTSTVTRLSSTANKNPAKQVSMLSVTAATMTEKLI